MSKKIQSVSYAMILLLSMLLISINNVQAASDVSILDGSYLTHDEESIGYATGTTRGEDLLAGYSKCVVRGPGKIYAGGTTIATHSVESIQVVVIVERARKGDTAWTYYANWEKTNHDTDRVGANRALDVEGGYYYRVRSIHAANDNVSSSFTDGVYVENP